MIAPEGPMSARFVSFLRRSRAGSPLLVLGCVGATWLCAPTPALGAAPEALTLGAFATGPETATVEGLVIPGGESTEYEVEYLDASEGSTAAREAASEWCDGKDVAVTRERSGPQSLPAGAQPFSPVTVLLSNLTAGDEYCAEVIALGGSSPGQRARFIAGAPTVLAESASGTGTTTATVGLSIDPASRPTSYEVQYGLASSAWCRSAGISGTLPEHVSTRETLSSEDGLFHQVSVALAGLAPGTEYCAVAVARHSTAQDSDGPVSFTTTGVRKLEVSIQSEHAGVGIVSGAGISCPGTCSARYVVGTSVTLSAAPAPGSTFVGWVGACAGTSTCTVAMGADHYVDAVFSAASMPPSSNPPHEKHKPVVDASTGEVQLEFEFPEAGTVETYGEVLHGATIARLPSSLTPSPTPVGSKRCKKGFVKKGKRCVSNAPVRYGAHTSTVSAGVQKLRVKPAGKVLAALERGKTLEVRVVLVFNPAGTKVHITATGSAKVRLERKHLARGGSARGH